MGMTTRQPSGAGNPDAGIPEVHRFLSSDSRATLATQLRERGLPVPSDLLRALSSPAAPGSEIPFAHEFLSLASRAYVAASLKAGGRPVPAVLLKPVGGSDLPFVHDLLSQASLAYVARSLESEGREVASGLRAALGRIKRVDSRIARAVADAPPPGEGSGGRFPESIGPYRLTRRLGKGGMGTVYACQRGGHGQVFAIKVINSGRLADPADRLRFKQEISVLLRLRHDNICRLRDFGQEGDSYWFVMDLVDGEEIDLWCRNRHADQALIAATMAQICRAVGHAHRQGIVHRDLTPANILILADGRPMVMDFGLARDLDSAQSMTITGMTVGTPPFMAPEQTRGKAGDITRSTDVWGAGATLYFLLTGRPPFDGDNTFEVFKAINERMVRRPRDLRPDIDPSLEMVILRCLQTAPRDRYGDMDSLARDLEEIAAGRRVRVRLPGFVTTFARQVRRRPLPWLLAGALAGTGLAFLGYVASQQIREWGTWSTVATYRAGVPLPAGLHAVDRHFAQRTMPTDAADGLPSIGSAAQSDVGWWWLEAPGMDGDLRITAEFTLDAPDSVDFAIGAKREPMRDWWHHPSGWGVKIETKEVVGASARYQERPGPVARSQMRLLPDAPLDRIRLRIERRDTRLHIAIDGGGAVVFDDPLAVGGGRAFGIRFYQPGTRMRALQVERLALAERVLPVAGGDALVRRGRFTDAVGEYRTVADDHRTPEIAGPALLRALAAACRSDPADEEAQQSILAAITRLGDPALVDQAHRIRAIWLWSQGRHAQAVGIAEDLTARAPDFTPFPAFMADSVQDLSAPLGPRLLALAGRAPPLGRLALARAGLPGLEALPRRKLVELSVPGNAIRDLAPLRGLDLRILEADDNRIADLAPLAGEPVLQWLSLNDNLVADLSPLAGVTSLERLNLARNPLDSLRGLPPNLVNLVVAGTPVADLGPLAGTRIASLSISGTRVRDLTPLRSLPQLRTLTISDLDLTDLSPLSGLPLTYLAAQRSRIDP
jgi:hypothetical protein